MLDLARQSAKRVRAQRQADKARFATKAASPSASQVWHFPWCSEVFSSTERHANAAEDIQGVLSHQRLVTNSGFTSSLSGTHFRIF